MPPLPERLPEPITSTRNPQVQDVRRLHRRSARLAERRFVVEGPQAVREALAADGLDTLFATGPSELVTAAQAAGVPVVEVSEVVLAAMGETVTPQGVLGTGPLVTTSTLPASPRLLVVLHEVSDPGNAGTVIRTADAAGADAVVLTGDSVDPHNGKCVRATAGSLWHLPVVTGVGLEQFSGLQVLATSGGAEEDLDDLIDSGDLAGPTAWVFGNEAHGLPADVLAELRTVRIPVHGRAESLNLASAAAVCLYATARAQRH